MQGKKPAQVLGSVDKALAVLRLVAQTEVVRVTDVARSLGVGRSTAFRMLAMLEYHGLVEQDEERRTYRAGVGLISLAAGVLGSLSVKTVARPHLEQLAQDLGETVFLTALRGTTIVFLDSVESSRLVRVGSRTGASMMAHVTAAGRAMLAMRSLDELRALYPNERLQRATARSLTSRSVLERQLALVRRRGYATNLGESEPDVRAVAVALVGVDGTLRGAVSAAAPSSRLAPAEIAAAAEALHASAEAIARKLGALDGAPLVGREVG